MNSREVKRLLAAIEASLLQAVPRAVAGMEAKEPLYAILFDYFQWETLNEGAPPMFVPAPVRVREEIMQEHGNPECVQWDAEYVGEILSRGSLLDQDRSLCELCVQGFELCREEGFDHERVHSMLRNVVKQLNINDWSKSIGVTDDFIVCVQDSSGEHDSQADFDLCVPTDKLALLRSRGYLWEW